jgi:hypothetical protein
MASLIKIAISTGRQPKAALGRQRLKAIAAAPHLMAIT